MRQQTGIFTVYIIYMYIHAIGIMSPNMCTLQGCIVGLDSRVSAQHSVLLGGIEDTRSEMFSFSNINIDRLCIIPKRFLRSLTLFTQ